MQTRLDKCVACPYSDHAGGVCNACGCVIVTKISMADQRCPLAKPKWVEVQPASSVESSR